ncbi:hypothetical protein DL93DRAFT_2170278 [Clavulina sp. PMI_390]|nr:hypothetical protein DL93DRAFT_2170278 [Clavulina sp. PMI_390]
MGPARHITADHSAARDIRSETSSLTQAQEDVLAVAIAGLFWLMLVMSLRTFLGSSASTGGAVAPYASEIASGGRRASRSHSYGAGYHHRLEESGCIPGPGRVCVIEEWFY